VWVYIREPEYKAMTTAGPSFPTTVVSNATLSGLFSTGNVLWLNPNNAKATDATYTTSATTNLVPNTYILTCTGFGFSVSGTILGITGVVLGHVTNTGRIADLCVQLLKATAGVGSNYADSQGVGFTGSLTDTTTTYGGSSDLWGTTWASTDINGSGFGIGYQGQTLGGSATLDIDSVTLAVTYSSSGSLFRQSSMAGVGAGGPFFQNPLNDRVRGLVIKERGIILPNRSVRWLPLAC